MKNQKDPIINCHTHIFTADHVPPYLAKTILPSFIYWLFNLNWIVAFFRFWYGTNGPASFQFKPNGKGLGGIIYKLKTFIARTFLINLLYWIAGLWLFVQTFFLLLNLTDSLPAENKNVQYIITKLIAYHIYVVNINIYFKLLFAIVLFCFFPSLRNLLLFIAKKLVKIIAALPGKETKELAKRYLTIGRHAFYSTQSRIFQNLRYQYPDGTKFIILPMDMEAMDAGKVNKNYNEQLQELIQMKKSAKYGNIIYPFVFIDPRRKSIGNKIFFSYTVVNDEVVLDPDCMLKELIEDHNFSGFKIYPALGYYPFDENLLALWKYAQQKNLPIMTHCIKGTIYYRGTKKKEWDTHPVFEQAIGEGLYESLLLPETDNSEFCNNFTHPLNYLCLLKEELFIKVLAKVKDKKIQKLFGYTPNCSSLTSNLSNLKICLAHFGGEEEWKRYFELDRDNYSTQVIKNPTVGIDFFKNKTGAARPGKLEQIWKGCDWYSIICSLMLQYDNIYADISYIAHDNTIHALLKRTLHSDNQKLRTRVLFGTDFYVVRNHKSEKQIMADTIGGLTEEEFDLIARDNPKTYLN